MDTAQLIIEGKGYLGIEFGSTRIKAVLVDKSGNVLASGGHSWENRYEDGVWTYSLKDIWDGLQDCYKDLKENVRCYLKALRCHRILCDDAWLSGV